MVHWEKRYHLRAKGYYLSMVYWAKGTKVRTKGTKLLKKGTKVRLVPLEKGTKV